MFSYKKSNFICRFTGMSRMTSARMNAGWSKQVLDISLERPHETHKAVIDTYNRIPSKYDGAVFIIICDNKAEVHFLLDKSKGLNWPPVSALEFTVFISMNEPCQMAGFHLCARLPLIHVIGVILLMRALHNRFDLDESPIHYILINLLYPINLKIRLMGQYFSGSTEKESGILE